jgi:LPS sulfotransferase NodH
MLHDVVPMCDHTMQIANHFAGNLIPSDRKLRREGELTIMCYTNRCGSSMVCSALSRMGLAGRPNGFLNYEYLHYDAVRAEAGNADAPGLEGYLQYCIDRYGSPGGSFTLKTSVQQLNFLIELGYMDKALTDARILFVRRRNVIAQAVSLWTVLQDGRWTSLHKPPAAPPPTYDPVGILQIARSIYEGNAWFEMLFDYHAITPITIWYEDYADNEAGLLSALAPHYARILPPGESALPVARQATAEKCAWESAVRALAVGPTRLSS